MERSTREGLWDDPIQYLQNQRGKIQYDSRLGCWVISLIWNEVTSSLMQKSPPNSIKWPMTCTSLPSPVRASLSWLWWVYSNTGANLVQNKRVMAHVTKWRSKCRQRGISGLHDWWLLYYCSLFLFVSRHKHHNNAVMSGPVPVMQANDAPIILPCFIAEAVMANICHQIKEISTIMFSFCFVVLVCCGFFICLILCVSALSFHSWPILCQPPITLRFCGILGERA